MRGELAEGTTISRLNAEVRKMRQETFVRLEEEFEAEMRELASVEQERERSYLAELLGAVIATIDNPGGVVRQPFTAGTNSSRTLRQWWKSFRDSDATRIRDALQLGKAQEETAKQIVDRIRGLRRFRFNDGVMALTRRHLESLVRTAITHVSVAARLALWLKNLPKFIGWMWVSVLDSKTSLICQTRDGDVALAPGVEKPPGINLLEPKTARPPAHPNCRSTMVPLTRGEMPERVNYEQWLRRQPGSFQDDVLGPGRAELFRRGRVSLDQFVDHSGRTLTLKELRDGV